MKKKISNMQLPRLLERNVKYLETLLGEKEIEKYKELCERGFCNSNSEIKLFDNINDTIIAMNNYGSNYWWESDDILLKSFYQLSTDKLLIPIDIYKNGLENLTGLRLNYLDLDKDRGRFKHIKRIAKLSYQTNHSGTNFKDFYTQSEKELASFDFILSAERKKRFLPLDEDIKRYVRALVGEKAFFDYTKSLSSPTSMNYEERKIFRKVRPVILAIEDSEGDFWWKNRDIRILAFCQLYYEPSLISFGDFKKGTEFLLGTMLTDSAFISSSLNSTRKMAIEAYKKTFLPTLKSKI